MSSGSQAAGEGQLQGWPGAGEGAPGGACSRSRQDSSLKLALTRLSLSSPLWGLWTLGQRSCSLRQSWVETREPSAFQLELNLYMATLFP